jgi:hypothetical protein
VSIESKSILYAPEKASARVGVLRVGAGLRNSEAPALNIKREPAGSQIIASEAYKPNTKPLTQVFVFVMFTNSFMEIYRNQVKGVSG